MNKVFTSMIAVAFAGVSFGAIAQPATKSTETKVESSTTVQTPKRADGKADEVKVDQTKKTTSTTTTAKPAAKADAKAEAKTTTTTTTTTAPKAGAETKVEVKSKTETKY